MSHTPTPWKAFRSTDGHVYIGIGDKDGGGIADAGFGMWRDGPEREANAELIVRAVNAHDELIECVKAALNMVDGDGMPPNWDWLRATVKSAGQP